MRVSYLVAFLAGLAVASLGMMRLDGTDPMILMTALPHVAPRGARAVTPVTPDETPRSLDAAPGGTLETQRLLRTRDFATLARRLEEAQRRVAADVRREGDLLRVLAAFDSADPTLTPLLDAWVATSRGAWTARLARATHFYAVAFRRRGTRASSETSDQQRGEMRDFLRKAVDDAQAALARNPGAALAHRLLIGAAMAVGDNAACLGFAGQALTVSPASLSVRARLATCLLPRWGGSYEALGALAKEAATHVKDNPSLASLGGWVDWDRGRVAATAQRDDDAVAFYTRAIAAGEYWDFYKWRARAYQRQNRYTDALADLTRALALQPEERGLLVSRAEVLKALGRADDAVVDVRFAGELDPTDDEVVLFRTRENEAAAFEAFQTLEVRKDPAGAILRLTQAIDMTGGSGDVFFQRGRARLALSDLPTALADFEHAIQHDPHHFEAYRNVDWILARQGDWDGIVARWTRYIALEPMSGPAFLERGGAFQHKGDHTHALADVRKACGLGTKEACELEKRLPR